MKMRIKEVEKIEIQTLQDNYVDFFAFKENNQMVQRPVPIKQTARGMELSQPPGAEHGWSSLITASAGETRKQLLFDFGWSEKGVAQNAELLGIDLTQVDLMALSHGHIDHFGGIKSLYGQVNDPEVELVLHPAAFRNPRYGKIMGDTIIYQPSLSREMLSALGVPIVETEVPLSVLDGMFLFLTGIERKTSFEKGMPAVYYREGDAEISDLIDDDSAIVMNLKDKGLVIVSGCGHAGIVNTIEYARKISGIEKIHAVIGGFHLTGPEFADRIAPTVESLKRIHPDHVVPTHCTGRNAIAAIEQAMPEAFIVNMSGTKLLFSSH